MPRAGRSDISIDMTVANLSAARYQIAALQDELLAVQEELSAAEDAAAQANNARQELEAELDGLRARIGAISDICAILGDNDQTFTCGDLRRLESMAAP